MPVMDKGYRRWVQRWKQSREKKVRRKQNCFLPPHIKYGSLYLQLGFYFHQLLQGIEKIISYNWKHGYSTHGFCSPKKFTICRTQGCSNIRSRWILFPNRKSICRSLVRPIKWQVTTVEVFDVHIVRSQVASLWYLQQQHEWRVVYITFLELRNISKSNSYYRSECYKLSHLP